MSRPFRLTDKITPEHELQMAIGQMLLVLAPRDAYWTSHELASKDSIEGRNKKRRFCMPGFPDMSFWWGGRIWLFELKTRVGRLSEVQLQCHRQLGRAGHTVHIARRPEDVEAVLRAAGVPLHGSIAA